MKKEGEQCSIHLLESPSKFGSVFRTTHWWLMLSLQEEQPIIHVYMNEPVLLLGPFLNELFIWNFQIVVQMHECKTRKSFIWHCWSEPSFHNISTLICWDWKKKRLSSPCPTIAAPDNPQAIRLVRLESCEKHRTFLERFPLCSVSSNQTRSNAREELDHAQIVFEARHEMTSVIIFTSDCDVLLSQQVNKLQNFN